MGDTGNRPKGDTLLSGSSMTWLACLGLGQKSHTNFKMSPLDFALGWLHFALGSKAGQFQVVFHSTGLGGLLGPQQPLVDLGILMRGKNEKRAMLMGFVGGLLQKGSMP